MIGHVLSSRGSIHRRISLVLTAGVCFLWMFAALAAGLALREETSEVFDSALQEVAQRVLPLAYTEILNLDVDAPDDDAPQKIASVEPHREYISYMVRDANGRILLQSHDADPAVFPMVLKAGFVDLNASRFYTESAVQGTIFVTTGERAGHRRGALIDSIKVLLWPLMLLLPLSLAGVWWLVTASLRPLKAFQDEIALRSSANLSPVHARELPAEIRPVAAAVNNLMQRLRRALDSERTFTANSAHELRTPVAAALAQTQRLMAELPPGPAYERACTIESALRRLAILSEKLLQLGKAQGGELLSDAVQDLAPVLGLVLDDAGLRDDRSQRLDIRPPTSGHFYSVMDVDAFAMLARNLIENALKHSAPETPVKIVLSDGGLFSVANECRVIPHETLARLPRPFERGETPADGSGLGLAIVSAIAKGIDSKIEFLSPVPGQSGGLEVRVQLPMRPKAT